MRTRNERAAGEHSSLLESVRCTERVYIQKSAGMPFACARGLVGRAGTGGYTAGASGCRALLQQSRHLSPPSTPASRQAARVLFGDASSSSTRLPTLSEPSFSVWLEQQRARFTVQANTGVDAVLCRE